MDTMSRNTMGERQPHEMMEKSRFRETFFSLRNVAQTRPDSVHTEFMETDWDEDDILSELEEDDGSPRPSLDSSGRPSMTTLSTYDEVRTPEQRSIARFEMGPDPVKPVVGPRGPHLFRSSISSVHSLEYQNALSMSPITPKAPVALAPFRFTHEQLGGDTTDLARWAPEKVAQWMLEAGVELQFAEKFVENDINGAILITLKFEDLKELGIASFGVRTTIWDEVAKLKDMPRAGSPDPETPIEDEPSREVKREGRRQQHQQHHHQQQHPPHQPVVSIVGIEQVLPKPHNCSKGEKCRKWKKQQRMIEAFKNDHPYVSLQDSGGVIMIAGDPGNPTTARTLLHRPSVPSVVASSDIMGTDGLAPLQYLQQAQQQQQRDDNDYDYDNKNNSTNSNVRRFLELQHQGDDAQDVPPTPPFEMLPPRKAAPHGGLRALSKLSIPIHRPVDDVPESACPGSACPGSAHPFAQQQQQQQQQQRHQQQTTLPTLLPTPSPSPSPSPTPIGSSVYRLGTPFSEMDVPYVSQPMAMLGPVSRDASQSVPPEMNYHTASNPPPPSRSLSRSTFRRPSFMAMPPVAENAVAPSPPAATAAVEDTTRRRRIPSPIETSRTTSPPRNQNKQTRPLQAPPRAAWPWSPPASARRFETAIAPQQQEQQANPTPPTSTTNTMAAADPAALDGYQYQGYMRKRKTKMLRHEWHEHYVTLKGTRLAMHKDRRTTAKTLEYVDIDDYAIACAGLASTSKLNAALKAMSIRSGSSSKGANGMSKADIAAFSFQLVPQPPTAEAGGNAAGGSRLLRKRESVTATPMFKRSGSWDGSSVAESGGVNGTGKTHHFAVRSRDERIDWMRELMLAKALKQKGEGFEVSVNGNMI